MSVSSISGDDAVGGLAGNNYGRIDNSFAIGSLGSIYGEAGGLVGHNNGVINNSFSSISINDAGAEELGGLVGMNYGTILNSYATGSITCYEDCGGLVGYNEKKIMSSYATGDVSSENGYSGGFVGYNNGAGLIESSYATGKSTSSDDAVGGFVGINYGDINNSYAIGDVKGYDDVGGFVGAAHSVNQKNITNCYSMGSVTITNDNDIGGFAGYANSGTLVNSFYDNETSGQAQGVGDGEDIGVMGKSTADMNSINTFFGAGWDFDAVWGINSTENDGYPFLLWQGYESEEPLFCGGDGSEGNPYQISDCQELQNMNLDLGAHYVLVNDIDCDIAPFNEGEGFEPIGNSTHSFNGSLNGQGYSISDLFVDRGTQQFVGLFGYALNSSISDLFLKGLNITGKDYVAGLAGMAQNTPIDNVNVSGTIKGENNWRAAGLVASYSKGIISNSHTDVNVSIYMFCGGLVGDLGQLSGLINSSSKGIIKGNIDVGGLIGVNSGLNDVRNTSFEGVVNGSYRVGGLIGFNQNGNVENSYAVATITGNEAVGGLVGQHMASGDDTVISNSFAQADVTTLTEQAGGMVGVLYGSNNNYATIIDSYAKGHVSGGNTIGGLVGDVYYQATINNSYSMAEASGTHTVGGLIGSISSSYTVNILNSYSTGFVNGSGNNIGGFIGTRSGGFINNSFYDNETSGQSTSSGGIAKSTAEMKDIATFAAWDIAVSEDDLNNGYPYLGWQNDNESVWLIFEEVIPLFENGDGSAENPYQISSCEELQNAKEELDAHYILMNDVDCSETVEWNAGYGFERIGGYGEGNHFTGSFDGQGFMVENLYMSHPYSYYQGVFGIVENATIKGLELKNLSVYGAGETGGLVGTAMDSIIENCSVKGMVDTTFTYSSRIVGLIGFNQGSNISDSYSNANVSSNGQYVGGLVGLHEQGNIARCYSEGYVRGGYGEIGGLVGHFHDGNIEDSYSTASVFSENAPSTYHISQLVDGEWIDMYEQGFGVDYEDYDFAFSPDEGRVVLKIVQRNVPFGNIDAVELRACDEAITAEYAVTEDGEDVLEWISQKDMNVVAVHDRPVEIAWDLKGCDEAIVSLYANEYGEGNPLSFKGRYDYSDEAEFSTYWEPSSGHPDGYTYIEISGDDENLYFDLDITGDNSHEFGEDWVEIKVDDNRFYVDDLNSEYGECWLAFTDKVDYRHKVCRLEIPRKMLPEEKFDFVLRYYGTLSISGTGGLVGYVNSGSVARTYAAGEVNSSYSISGGLIGVNHEGDVADSYWDKETTGQTDSEGGVAKTTAEMMKSATFENWDFDVIWGIEEEKTYPFLFNPGIIKQEEEKKGSSGSGGGYSGCRSDWICGNWSECANGTQTRVCELEFEYCVPRIAKPNESMECEAEVEEEEPAEEEKEEEEKQQEEEKTVEIEVGIEKEDNSTVDDTTSDDNEIDMVPITGQAVKEEEDDNGSSFWGILILILIGGSLLLILLFRRRNSVLYG